MRHLDLPDPGHAGTVLYSDWRSGVLSEAEASRQKEEASRGHAIAITPHPDSTEEEDSYTEVVSCVDQRTGEGLHGVRTVRPDGEELVRFPSAVLARECYRRIASARR